VKSALKHVGRVMTGMLSAAVLARLDMPALAAAGSLAVLVLGVTCWVTCWVIDSGERSDRVTRMIYARHGDARCLPHRPVCACFPAAAPATCPAPLDPASSGAGARSPGPPPPRPRKSHFR
jgi:hypothetical protein